MKLGKRQLALLATVCQTNGGGVYISGALEKTAKRLEELELIQGKSSAQYCAVHTRKGLALWRELSCRK